MPKTREYPNHNLLFQACRPQILADQLTLSQPGAADYAHHITTGTPGFLDLPTALLDKIINILAR